VLTRRRFLQITSASFGAAGTTGLYSWLVEPHWIEFVHRPLPIRGLARHLEGRTLVQISDIHVGPRVDDDYVVDTFRRISALEPDVVVLTGDFISYHDTVYDQLARVYRHAPKGRLATLAILGNHDYGWNWSHREVAARIVEIVEPLGIKVLRNEIADVEGLQIAGLDDFWGPAFNPSPVLDAIDPARASVVLSHNPDTVDLPIWNGYEGWILSGHTHGGQCKPPFLPPPLLPVRNRRYTAGEFLLSGNRQLYINRGVGHLMQIRFNVRPEVTFFELMRA
jgi:uncharacterized protein